VIWIYTSVYIQPLLDGVPETDPDAQEERSFRDKKVEKFSRKELNGRDCGLGTLALPALDCIHPVVLGLVTPQCASH